MIMALFFLSWEETKIKEHNKTNFSCGDVSSFQLIHVCCDRSVAMLPLLFVRHSCLLQQLTRRVYDFRTVSSFGLIRISDQVKTALNEGRPIVALESTIITHGMPFPDNLR